MVRAFKTSASIICYEIPWNYVDFKTQFFIKLTERNLYNKIKAINFYESQKKIRKFYFNEDFIRGMAITRGSQVITKYAEAFEVIRWIIK